MVNNFGEAIAAFVAMPETRKIAQPKELNTTNINRKILGARFTINRKGSTPHSKIDLPLNSFIFCIFVFVHICPPFTRKRIVSLYFGRVVRTRLGVAIF